MIKNLNTKNLTCFGKLTMDVQVGFTRLKFSRWVVMNKNHPCCTVSNDISKNLPRMDRAFVKETNCDNALFDHLICSIERNAHEVFLLFSGNVTNKWQDILGTNNFDHLFEKMAPGKFKS